MTRRACACHMTHVVPPLNIRRADQGETCDKSETVPDDHGQLTPHVSPLLTLEIPALLKILC